MQGKKAFAFVDYSICNPQKCNAEEGICWSVKGCTHKVIKQIDGAFEPPVVFQDLCMGCWDCIEACPLSAIQMREIL